MGGRILPLIYVEPTLHAIPPPCRPSSQIPLLVRLMRPSRPASRPRKQKGVLTRSVSTKHISKAEFVLISSLLPGNVVVGANSIYESIASNETATQAFSLVKEQANNFAQRSKVLMDVLDEVAKAHPFIQGTSIRVSEWALLLTISPAAVVLFKVGLTLELTHRENEEKVLALNLTMCDMMEVLTMHVPRLS